MAAFTNLAISTNTSGANELVAATAGKSAHVRGLVLVSANTVTVTIKSGATALSGAMTLTAGEALVLPIHDRRAWFATAAGEALVLTLGGAVQVSGALIYTQD